MLSKILNEPLLNNTNRIFYIFDRLKASFWYSLSFKSIGRGSIIAKPLFIKNPQYMTIGSNVSIKHHIRMEAVKTSVSRNPELTIGDNTNIEQNVHIICHNKVHIGSNVSITGNCAIVDTTHPYEDVCDPVKIGDRLLDDDASVEIGNGSFIGFGSMILPNVKIGEYVIIGAHSVVTKDVPSYCVAIGNPAKAVKTYDFDSKCWVNINQSKLN